MYLTWTRRPSVSVLGTCHSIFRVISISKALDTDSLPPDCLDFVMYHEFLHVRQGVRIGKRKHDSDFRREEQGFPGYERIKRDLAGLKVRIPSIRRPLCLALYHDLNRIRRLNIPYALSVFPPSTAFFSRSVRSRDSILMTSLIGFP